MEWNIVAYNEENDKLGNYCDIIAYESFKSHWTDSGSSWNWILWNERKRCYYC